MQIFAWFHIVHLSHAGSSMRSVMSEELYKKQGAMEVLDAEHAWLRQLARRGCFSSVNGRLVNNRTSASVIFCRHQFVTAGVTNLAASPV